MRLGATWQAAMWRAVLSWCVRASTAAPAPGQVEVGVRVRARVEVRVRLGFALV